jgi:hypothetical protein
MSKNPLDYRTPRDGIVPWAPSRHQITVALLIIVATLVVGWIMFVGPTGAQIRLDTGDLRYTYYGIPGASERMGEPARTRILSLAATSSVLKAKWVSVPYDAEHVPHEKLDEMYWKAAAWEKVDWRIAKAPEPVQEPIFFEVLVDAKPTRGGTVTFYGRHTETTFNDYLKSKGIPIPATNPATKPSA